MKDRRIELFKLVDPSIIVLVGAIIGIVGGLISGVGAYRAARNQSLEQTEMRKKADEVADSQRELRKKSDEIAHLYQTLAASQRELKEKADIQADSQRQLTGKSDEIAALNREISNNQIALRQKSEEIAQLSNASLSSITGGDSYCYLSYIQPGNANRLMLVVNHVGKYPLYDVNMRIVDLHEFSKKIKSNQYTIDDIQKDKAIKIESMTPEMTTMTFDELVLPDSGEMELNVFITARNGYWIQNIKLKRINRELKQRTILEKQIGLSDKVKLYEQNEF